MYLKIKCFTCGGKFHLYHKDLNRAQTTAVRCPYCYAKLNEKALERLVDAFYTLNDCNIFLEKQAEQGEPLFQATAGAHYYPFNKIKLSDN